MRLPIRLPHRPVRRLTLSAWSSLRYGVWFRTLPLDVRRALSDQRFDAYFPICWVRT